MKVTQKEVTILFSDIEASSKFWDRRGDKIGRLMIDTQNRLIFPIVKKYQGKIVKTIGDAWMVSFKKPVNALKAAIAIQQILLLERKKNLNFPKVRIGIHTGKAVVERGDVFGDMVNVASRIENKARGNEILLSAKTAQKLSRKQYHLIRKDRFKPKGKQTEITLYQCQWRKAVSHIDNIRFGSLLVLKPFQKLEILGSTLASLGMILLLYLKYIRYLFSDREWLILFILNPRQMLLDKPVLLLLPAACLVLIVFLLLRIRIISIRSFQIMQGGAGFCIGYFLFYMATSVFHLNIGLNAEKVLYRSEHRFVEVVAAEAAVHQTPDFKSKIIRSLPRGTLLLLADYRKKSSVTWNKVLIRRGRYGWMVRVRPPRMGVPEERMTRTDRFVFKVKDLYSLIAGLIGFLIGYFSFKIRPA